MNTTTAKRPRILMTPGVEELADRLGAYWLTDIIVSYIVTNAACRNEDMTFWTATLTKTGGARIEANDGGKMGNEPVRLVRQNVPHTNLTEDVRIWVGRSEDEHGTVIHTLLLPEEY